MKSEDIPQNFYRERIEGGSHINLRRAIVKYLSGRIKAKRYLDIGCADGSFSIQIGNAVEAEEIFGVDLSHRALKEARGKGIITYYLDMNKEALPFNEDSIDLITSFEVIEHLVNPDNLICESFRVLRKGGKFIISTPNLASWINRIYLLMGRQPRGFEVSLKLKLDGMVREYHQPAGHIRLYTLRALKEHLSSYGFKIIKVIACPQPISIHKRSNKACIKFLGYIHNWLDWLLGRFPSITNDFAIVAEK